MAITKDQLIGDLAEATSLPKASVRNLLDQLAEIVGDALENDGEITLPGIGKLKVSERPARTGRDLRAFLNSWIAPAVRAHASERTW